MAILLILGLALWTAVHLFKPAMPARRAELAARFGEGPVKGAAALLLVLSIVMMVWGYGTETMQATHLYFPPRWTVHLNNLLMLLAFVLLGAGHAKSNIRRYVRHPMLTAVKVWALAHLIANGTLGAVLLFGGMLGWAVASVVLINRRDGAFVKPEPSPRRTDLVHLGASLVLFVVFLLIHPWLFGVSPLPV
jgi:uncharacterized membrane protein